MDTRKERDLVGGGSFRWTGRAFVVLAVASTSIAALDATQRIVGLRFRTPLAELPALSDLLQNHFVPWWLWAAVVPVVGLLTQRFPLDRGRFRNLGLHLLLGALVAAVFQLVLALVVSYGSSQGVTVGGVVTAARVSATWRFLLDYLIYWAVAGALHAVSYRRRLGREELERARRESESARARLSALEARLHPHFLFNTLNTVSALVRNDRADEAVRTVALLSDLLRRVLSLEPGTLIPFDEELEMADLYVDIVEARFGERLTIRRNIDADTLDAAVPPFLLQPLLENAFRHGFDASNAPGEVAIHSRREGTDLAIEIRDSGPGFPEGFRLESAEGLGLKITGERIEGVFGGHGTVRVGPAEGGGGRVELRIPFHPCEREVTEAVAR